MNQHDMKCTGCGRSLQGLVPYATTDGYQCLSCQEGRAEEYEDATSGVPVDGISLVLGTVTRLPHACALDHPEIRFGGDDERCPVCRLRDEVETLKHEVNQIRRQQYLDLCERPDAAGNRAAGFEPPYPEAEP